MSLARGVGAVVTYVAFDYTNNTPKSGDAANHTLRLIRDGTESAPLGTPIEVDATFAPGLYELALTGNEMSAVLLLLAGKSSTPGVGIVPEMFATE